MAQNQALLDQTERDQSLLTEERALRLQLESKSRVLEEAALEARQKLEEEREVARALKASLRVAEKTAADAMANNDAIRSRMEQVGGCVWRRRVGLEVHVL